MSNLYYISRPPTKTEINACSIKWWDELNGCVGRILKAVGYIGNSRISVNAYDIYGEVWAGKEYEDNRIANFSIPITICHKISADKDLIS